MQKFKWQLIILLVLILSGCSSSSMPATSTPPATHIRTQITANVSNSAHADVLGVHATGQPNAYQFEVKVSSPDTGCNKYADWWEVLDGSGQLLYRRVLLHSHVDEQPFTRAGGPVPIAADTVVFVRAHMSQGGYGGQVLQGSVVGGFEAAETKAGFGAEVELLPPLPDDCAF